MINQTNDIFEELNEIMSTSIKKMKEENRQNIVDTLEVGQESVQLVSKEALTIRKMVEEWTDLIIQICDQTNDQFAYSLELTESEGSTDELWFWHTINLLFASLQLLEVTTTDFLGSIHDWELEGFKYLKNTARPFMEKWLDQHQEEIEKLKQFSEK